MNIEHQFHLAGFEPVEPASPDGTGDGAGDSAYDASLHHHAGHAVAVPEEPGAGNTEATHNAGQGAEGEGSGGANERVRTEAVYDRRSVAMDTPGWRYPISHLAFLIRPMTDEEFLNLVEDIRETGLLYPISRWRGEIIDGVHRLLACLKVGFEPSFEDIVDDADPASHIWSKNVVRRHLSVGERAECAVSWSARSKRGRRQLFVSAGENSAKLRNKPESITQSEAASLFKVSPRLVTHAIRVFSDDSTATPELRQAVREDRVAVSDASQIVQEPPEVQRRAMRLAASGEVRTVAEGVRRIRPESAGPRKEDTQAYDPAYIGKNISIYNAKVADLHMSVEPGTVDVIICSPPRDVRPAILSHLGIFASHALTEEGLLIVAADTGQLPEMLDGLRRGGPRWVMECSLLFPAPIAESEDPHYLDIRRVALLILGKSGAKLREGDDVIEVSDHDTTTGKGRLGLEDGIALVVSRFVSQGQVVCNPILNGLSEVAMAAVEAGCRFIGADHDKRRIDAVVKELSLFVKGPSSDDKERG